MTRYQFCCEYQNQLYMRAPPMNWPDMIRDMCVRIPSIYTLGFIYAVMIR